MKDERIFAKRKVLVFILSTVLALSLLLGISAACEEEHTHSLTRHAALSPTCKNDGTIEYWECTGCKKLFSDEAATTEITLEQTIAPATGDHDWANGAIRARQAAPPKARDTAPARFAANARRKPSRQRGILSSPLPPRLRLAARRAISPIGTAPPAASIFPTKSARPK